MKPKFNYFTEEESKYTKQELFFEGVLGIELCQNRNEIMEILDDIWNIAHSEGVLFALKEYQSPQYKKSNHIIGCEIESYSNILELRGFKKEADMIDLVASRLK